MTTKKLIGFGIKPLAATKKRNKYKAKPVVVDGVRFASKLEYRRWCELVMLEKAGVITDLKRQIPFVLAPQVRFYDEKRAKPALRYFADFVYTENGLQVVEDAKGDQTGEFRTKRQLMISVHGIQIRLTGARK